MIFFLVLHHLALLYLAHTFIQSNLQEEDRKYRSGSVNSELPFNPSPAYFKYEASLENRTSQEKMLPR